MENEGSCSRLVTPETLVKSKQDRDSRVISQLINSEFSFLIELDSGEGQATNNGLRTAPTSSASTPKDLHNQSDLPVLIDTQVEQTSSDSCGRSTDIMDGSVIAMSASQVVCDDNISSIVDNDDTGLSVHTPANSVPIIPELDHISDKQNTERSCGLPNGSPNGSPNGTPEVQSSDLEKDSSAMEASPAAVIMRYKLEMSGEKDEQQLPSPHLEDGEQDEDSGVYAESFRASRWIFVDKDDTDETAAACEEETLDANSEQRSRTETGFSVDSLEQSGFPPVADPPDRSQAQTGSQYRRAYRQVSVKQIQRKGSIGTFRRENTTLITAEKVVHMERTNSESGFGFHIAGSHPTVVSTVLPDSIAHKVGIEVGDVILAIDYDSVLHQTHEEIVQKLLQATTRITIELCKESSLTATESSNHGSTVVCEGYVNKLVNNVLSIWKRRWFVLKSDNCLYYYKSREDPDIMGAIPLSGYTVQRGLDMRRQRPYTIQLMHHTKSYYFAADNEQEVTKWAQYLNEAVTSRSSMDSWLDMSSHNVGLPALSIRKADYCGYLYKMGGRYKSWKQRYAVLKDGCLYYYCDVSSRSAQGVAHLQGYTVDSVPPGPKKNAFDLIPPDQNMRTFHFYCDTSYDKDRWTRAIKISLSRWVKVS